MPDKSGEEWLLLLHKQRRKSNRDRGSALLHFLLESVVTVTALFYTAALSSSVWKGTPARAAVAFFFRFLARLADILVIFAKRHSPSVTRRHPVLFRG